MRSRVVIALEFEHAFEIADLSRVLDDALDEGVLQEAIADYVDGSDYEDMYTTNAALVGIDAVTDTNELVTDEQLKELRDEAGAAGDAEQVSLCIRALAGEYRARVECALVIAEAKVRAS